MKRILIFCFALILLGSCGDQCFKCQDINGYPNATICRDTYQTTITENSPTWDDYQSGALAAGCVRQ